MKITSWAGDLKPGDRITIAGLSYGPQYEDGFTWNCKPGHETVMVIGEDMSAAPISRPARTDRRRTATQRAKVYGPPARKRWSR